MLNPETETREYFLKIAKCQFCNTYLVVMDTERGSVLPVEVADKNVKISIDEIYDKSKHISHLLNCPQQQAVWEKKKMKFLKQRNPFLQIKDKDLLK